LASDGDGLVWEHYTPDWSIDWEYNRGNQTDRFRPWGYQTGHQLEWSKLLAILAQYREEDWLLPTAERLFETAVEYGWDDEYGGLFYTFDREGTPLMEEKYYWKVTEGIGAAALLGQWTGADRYWEWYDRFWEYAWNNMINRSNGNWYFKLTRENEFDPAWEEAVDETTDQTPIVKTDYHGVNACRESLLAATSGFGGGS
jgi:mannose/cellobiose epimerase-like protein (N-acyl-D-glucosamine 2-epimerase family)